MLSVNRFSVKSQHWTAEFHMFNIFIGNISILFPDWYWTQNTGQSEFIYFYNNNANKTGNGFCSAAGAAELCCWSSVKITTLPVRCVFPGFHWVWDEGCKSSGAHLSCDSRKVSFHSDYSCGTAAIRGTKELSDGQHYWEVKMTSPVYGTDMVSVGHWNNAESVWTCTVWIYQFVFGLGCV